MNAHRVTAKGASVQVFRVGAFNQLYYFSWYPDGQHVAVLDAGNLHFNDTTIRRLDVLSGATTALTDRRLLLGMPAVSPDGEWIAIAGQRNYGQDYNESRNIIWLKDPAGHFASLEVNPGQRRAPAWSPDSN